MLPLHLGLSHSLKIYSRENAKVEQKKLVTAKLKGFAVISQEINKLKQQSMPPV